jgi:hypothetical protein
MASQPGIHRKQFFFTGEWIPNLDPLLIGEENFAELINQRYAQVGIEGVLGYSKINSTPLDNKFYPGYYKGRSGVQLKSPYDDQDRVLIQAWDSTLSFPGVMENTAAVPGAGEFETSAVWTDGTGADLGRFAIWPNGHIAYCNGVESCVWAGDELRCAGFKVYDPSGSFKYDYSSIITNMEDDANNRATLHRVSESLDANTIALYHLDNAVTDATATHNASANGAPAYSTTTKVFGTHALILDGTNDYLTVADHADFDFSGGTFTIDFRMRITALPGAGKAYSLYRQETAGTGNDWFDIFLDENGAINVQVKADHGGAPTVDVDMATADGTITTATWYHVEVVESGDNWYIFVDGVQKAYLSDTDRCANYTGTIYIGYDGASGAGYYMSGHLDEYRISDVARHTDEFEIPLAAYGSVSYRTYMYVGSTRPIQGIKFYVQTQNTTAGDLNVEYWNGTSWASVASLVDGTESPAGTPLGQTGTVSFADTDGSAEVRVIDSVAIYWYRVSVTECNATTTVYHISVDADFQSVKDLWDGVYRTIVSFLVYSSSTYNDYTTNVADTDYSSANAATYANLASLASTNYLVVGSQERLMGLSMILPGGQVNTNSAVLTVSYWNGTTWVSVGPVNDGTLEAGKALAKTGTVTWNPPAVSLEFTTAISSEIPLYYYKFQWSAKLSANVKIDYVGGITAPREIPGGWRFPFMFGTRPMLCGYLQGKEGNRIDYGLSNAVDVWNGEESSDGYAGSIYLGGSEDLTCACELFNRFGAAIFSFAVFCKNTETYVINGTGPEDWTKHTISNKTGCPAPMTMDTAEVGYDFGDGLGRNVALWLSYSGPVLFDGAVIMPISARISNFFDPTKSECINFDAIESALGWVDSSYSEYNLVIPTGTSTTPDRWLCFDLVRRRWFEKEPIGTNPYPGAAFRVSDDYGTEYVYGLFDDGYMRRLEHGTTWDGEDITQTVTTSDMVPSSDLKGGGIWDYASVNSLKVLANTITEDVDLAVTHYRDGNATGQTLQSVESTGSNRYKRKTQKLSAAGNGYSHQFSFSVATNATEKGLPLLGWGMLYEIKREDTRDAE